MPATSKPKTAETETLGSASRPDVGNGIMPLSFHVKRDAAKPNPLNLTIKKISHENDDKIWATVEFPNLEYAMIANGMNCRYNLINNGMKYRNDQVSYVLLTDLTSISKTTRAAAKRTVKNLQAIGQQIYDFGIDAIEAYEATQAMP